MRVFARRNDAHRLSVSGSGSGSGSRSALWAPSRPHDFGGSAPEDDEISPQRPVLDVVVVEAGAFGDRGVSPQAVHLRPAGEPDRQPVTVLVSGDAGPEAPHEEGPFWSEPDG